MVPFTSTPGIMGMLQLECVLPHQALHFQRNNSFLSFGPKLSKSAEKYILQNVHSCPEDMFSIWEELLIKGCIGKLSIYL